MVLSLPWNIPPFLRPVRREAIKRRWFFRIKKYPNSSTKRLHTSHPAAFFTLQTSQRVAGRAVNAQRARPGPGARAAPPPSAADRPSQSPRRTRHFTLSALYPRASTLVAREVSLSHSKARSRFSCVYAPPARSGIINAPHKKYWRCCYFTVPGSPLPARSSLRRFFFFFLAGSASPERRGSASPHASAPPTGATATHSRER